MENILKRLFQILFFNLAILQFCNHSIEAQPMKKAFINGKIYTVNEKQPYAEMVVT